jgi:hypothetical protein
VGLFYLPGRSTQAKGGSNETDICHHSALSSAHPKLLPVGIEPTHRLVSSRGRTSLSDRSNAPFCADQLAGGSKPSHASKSGWRDLNPRPRGPRPRALAKLSYILNLP